MRYASSSLQLRPSSTPAQQAPPATEVYLMALPLGCGRPRSLGLDQHLQQSGLRQSAVVSAGQQRGAVFVEPRRQADGHLPLRHRRQGTEAGHDHAGQRVLADGDAGRKDVFGDSPGRGRWDATAGEDTISPRARITSVVFENVKPVGYHAWIDPTHVAMFILGSGQGAPATLQIGDTKTGTAEVVATGIGRSVLVRPGAGTVSYITTGANRDGARVRSEDSARAGSFAPIEGSQDAVWTPNGSELGWRTNTADPAMCAPANRRGMPRSLDSTKFDRHRDARVARPVRPSAASRAWRSVRTAAGCVRGGAAKRSPGSRVIGQSRRIAAVQAPVIPTVGRWLRATPGTISFGQGMVVVRPTAGSARSRATIRRRRRRIIGTVRSKGCLNSSTRSKRSSRPKTASAFGRTAAWSSAPAAT